MQEKVNSVISKVCDIVGEHYGEEINASMLFEKKSNNVERRISTARQIVHYILHRDLTYSVTFIARATGVTRNNVFSNVRKATDLLSVDNTFRKLYEKSKSIIL